MCPSQNGMCVRLCVRSCAILAPISAFQGPSELVLIGSLKQGAGLGKGLWNTYPLSKQGSGGRLLAGWRSCAFVPFIHQSKHLAHHLGGTVCLRVGPSVAPARPPTLLFPIGRAYGSVEKAPFRPPRKAGPSSTRRRPGHEPPNDSWSRFWALRLRPSWAVGRRSSKCAFSTNQGSPWARSWTPCAPFWKPERTLG